MAASSGQRHTVGCKASAGIRRLGLTGGRMEKQSRRGPGCRQRLLPRTLKGASLASATTYGWLHERGTGRYDGLVG